MKIEPHSVLELYSKTRELVREDLEKISKNPELNKQTREFFEDPKNKDEIEIKISEKIVKNYVKKLFEDYLSRVKGYNYGIRFLDNHTLQRVKLNSNLYVNVNVEYDHGLDIDIVFENVNVEFPSLEEMKKEIEEFLGNSSFYLQVKSLYEYSIFLYSRKHDKPLIGLWFERCDFWDPDVLCRGDILKLRYYNFYMELTKEELETLKGIEKIILKYLMDHFNSSYVLRNR